MFKIIQNIYLLTKLIFEFEKFKIQTYFDFPTAESPKQMTLTAPSPFEVVLS